MAARRHWRFVVRDQYGFVIQNAQVFVYQPGTTTAFTGTAYNAASGGSPVTNPFTTNAFGEVEAWFDTAQVVDVLVTDNTNTAYRAVGGVSDTLDFPSFTEKDDIYVSASDGATAVGVVGDITAIDPGDAAAAGASGRYADAAHQHTNTGLPNAHGIASHTDVTRSVFLAVNDGAVADGGTLAVRGTLPDALRVITLADAATSGALWVFEVPNNWASGAIGVEIWHAGQTTAGGVVRWSIDMDTIAEGASVVAAGTTVAFNGQAPTTADLLVKEAIQTLETPAAAGDMIRLSVRRIGADAGDTYAASTSLIGVRLTYTANQ